MTWYSSSPSWRFISCDDTTTGAAASSNVISNVITARWRCTQADHPRGPDAHPLAGRRAPHEVPFEDAGAEVDAALVFVEVGAGEQQRLVVDVQLHQLGVGHVDDRLAGLGEPEGVLGVLDVPGLVEAVEVRAVAVRLAALLRVGPHPEVAVAEGEERLGQAEVVVAELALDEPPRLDREAVLGEPGRDGMVVHGATIGPESGGTESGGIESGDTASGSSSARSSTTMSAPWDSSVS